MTELQCPVCKKDSYIDPQIKIYISPCYHKLCSTCINRLFNVEGPCPQCGIPLKRVNFFVQNFEDLDIEKECRIRKMIPYRDQSEFEDEEAYNDYLETMENLVFELMELKSEDVVKRINLIRQPSKKIIKEETFNPIQGLNPIVFEKIPEIENLTIFNCKNQKNLRIFIMKAMMSLLDDQI